MSELDTSCYKCRCPLKDGDDTVSQEVVGWVGVHGTLVLQINTGRRICGDCLLAVEENYKLAANAGDNLEKYTVDVRQYNIGFDAGWRGNELAFTETFYSKDFWEGYNVGRSARSNA